MSAMPDLDHRLRREQRRERLIDAALEMWAASGYEASTVEQITILADTAPDRFEDYFESKGAVVMAVLDDIHRGTAEALRNVGDGLDPERALLTATVEVLAAIAEGRRVTTVNRLTAVAQLVRTHPDLKKRVSTARRRAISRALAERLGVDTHDARVRLTTTKWSAVASAAYQIPNGMGGAPRTDDRLTERMAAEVAAVFYQVTGNATGASG